MKKRVLIGVLIIITICLGFLRDYIFVSINRFIESGADAGERLLLLKWVLTGLFSLLYLLLTGAFLYVLFNEKKYILIAIYCYAMLFVVAFLSAAFGYGFFTFKIVYPFIRTVMGMAQSPILMMILVTACYINEINRQNRVKS
ncbi:MAG: hypothetical protein EPN85_12675 [Bacteroidetes bacterium]|nr:MAG: hypothetical protein EPN85_12675 [Bacteroidota bacterium]